MQKAKIRLYKEYKAQQMLEMQMREGQYIGMHRNRRIKYNKRNRNMTIDYDMPTEEMGF